MADVRAVVAAELAQGLDEEVVDREPDRAAPVRVAALDPGLGLAGLISDADLAGAQVDVDRKGWVAVKPRHASHAAGRKEPALLKDTIEDRQESMLVHESNEALAAGVG